MRIVIFGAGAVGGLFGGHLAGKHEVTLVCRDPDPINRKGLRITGQSDIHAHPRAAGSAEGLEPPELLMLTVKAYDTEKAARQMLPLVGPRTEILSLQNGLGNLEIIEKTTGRRPMGSVTSQGAIFHEPGLIEHTGRSYTFVGDRDIAEVFSEAGLETRYSDDIRSEIWYKAAVNCVINPLGTLMRERNGLLVRDERFRPLARQIVSECIAVANAEGIELDHDTAWKKTVQVAAETAENICSMRKDVEAGKRTEIMQMNGAVARYGQEQGIGTSANGLLTALIKSMEK